MNSSTTKMTPRDFFLYLGSAVTLYWSAFSLLLLLFSIIDAALPDALGRTVTLGSGEVRFAIASLVVIFPVYLWLSWRIRSDVVAKPTQATLSIRRWFIYLTLFLAGALFAGDIIALINTFLGGEVTGRFLLKALSVAIVAVVVFSYYRYDLRRAGNHDVRVRTEFVWIAGLAVLAVIVGGFFVMGTPGEQRDVRFDQERERDLQSLQFSVVEFWRAKEALPADSAALEEAGFVVPEDPETDEPYAYRVLEGRSFELCADFARTTSEEERRRASARFPTMKDFGGVSQDFTHEAGRTCFTRTIDPDFFIAR